MTPLQEQQLRESFDKEFSHVGWIPENKEHLIRFMLAKLNKALEEREKTIRDEIILFVTYACAEYTNMHQDTDNENIAVNTVRSKIFNRIEDIFTLSPHTEECYCNGIVNDPNCKVHN